MNVERKLETQFFNSFLIQECAGVEKFYSMAIRKDVAPPMLRGIFMSADIGAAPYTQQVHITSEDNQPGEIAEAAEAAYKDHPDYTLVACFFLSSLAVTNSETGDQRKMLLISGKTNDGRTNAGFYFYDIDEDGRYHVMQDLIRGFDPESPATIEVTTVQMDAYFRAWSRAKLAQR